MKNLPYAVTAYVCLASTVAAAVDVPATVFGVATRTPYCTSDTNEFVAYFQDVRYSNGTILRYTTQNGAGNGAMDVYYDDGSQIKIIKGVSITHDAAGNPTSITGVQGYVPQHTYGPLIIPADSSYTWNQTVGAWNYCPGDCDPFANPVVTGSVTENVAMTSDGITLWLTEEYYNGANLEYNKVFSYTVGQSGSTLDYFYDYIWGKLVVKKSSVNAAGVCQ